MNTLSVGQTNNPNYAYINYQPTPTNNSPVLHPFVAAIVVDEVNKPIEV